MRLKTAFQSDRTARSRQNHSPDPVPVIQIHRSLYPKGAYVPVDHFTVGQSRLYDIAETFHNLGGNASVLTRSIVGSVEQKDKKILALFRAYLRSGYFTYFQEFDDISLYSITLEQEIPTLPLTISNLASGEIFHCGCLGF